MFSRYIALVFLCLANLVMLGDNLVPHHHHDPQAEIAGHDHHDSDPDHGHEHHHHHDADHGEDHPVPGDDHGHTPFHFDHAPLAFVADNGSGVKLQSHASTPCILTEALEVAVQAAQHAHFIFPAEPQDHGWPPLQAPGLRAPPAFIV